MRPLWLDGYAFDHDASQIKCAKDASLNVRHDVLQAQACALRCAKRTSATASPEERAAQAKVQKGKRDDAASSPLPARLLALHMRNSTSAAGSTTKSSTTAATLAVAEGFHWDRNRVHEHTQRCARTCLDGFIYDIHSAIKAGEFASLPIWPSALALMGVGGGPTDERATLHALTGALNRTTRNGEGSVAIDNLLHAAITVQAG